MAGDSWVSEEGIWISREALIELCSSWAHHWWLVSGYKLETEVDRLLASGELPDLRWFEQFRRKPGERSRTIPSRVRRKVMERDKGVCKVCGSADNVSLDHIEPFSKGGRHTVGNLRVLCKSCNSSRGTKPDRVWLRGRDG